MQTLVRVLLTLVLAGCSTVRGEDKAPKSSKTSDFTARIVQLENEAAEHAAQGNLAALRVTHDELRRVVEGNFPVNDWTVATIRLRVKADQQLAAMDETSQLQGRKAIQRFAGGTALEDEGNFSRAIDFYTQALSLFQDVLGDGINSAETMERIASCHIRLNQYSEALPFAERATSATRSTFGENHAAVSTSLILVADAQLQLGKFELAAKNAAQSIAIAKRSGLEEELAYARMTLVMAMAENKLENYAQAIPYAQESISIYSMERPLNLTNLLRSQAELAKAYAFLGKHPQCVRIASRIRSLMQLNQDSFPKHELKELLQAYHASLVACGKKEAATSILQEMELLSRD